MLKTIFALFITMGMLYADYLGDNACKACHATEHKTWHGSDHDLAMQKADATSVLGDFNKTTFDYNGIVSTFFKKDGKFMVRTDGPDGKLHDYEIAFTFGVHPLQQYLIPFPDGKFQVLDIAWDTRKKAASGQRWFHLHPDDNVTAGDPLHWSGPTLNWNYMCADCHSTNLKKSYDPKTRKYATTYDAINVSCEACHGPGSEHAAWAKAPKTYKGSLKKGLHIDLSAFSKERWKIDGKSGKPVRLVAIDRTEVELCAKCHARRSQLDDTFVPGERFDDHYLLSGLTDPLYFPDGKIEDEVYVYGSFLQSKMYAHGVTCSDCHDPHSLQRKAQGDNVCNRCHRRVDYDTPKHHFHAKGGAGCIDCHMPPRTYMGVDVRNDHSFRIPRPDLSVGTNIPNACNLCHTDKTAQWAAETLKQHYEKVPVGKQDFAHAFIALRSGSDTAPQSLYDVLLSDAPHIAKATAAAYLGSYPSRQTYTTVRQLLRSDDAMVRLNALKSLEAFPLQMRAEQTFTLLDDPVLSVRIEAAQQLSAIAMGDLSGPMRMKLEQGIEAYRQTLLFNSDRAESQSALGTLYANLGQPDKAEAAYDEALRLQPWFVPAYINFAHFYQNAGNERKAYEILQKGLENVKENPALLHALGLWYVRRKAPEKALDSLRKAARLAPENARFQYVYAVARSATDLPGAIRVLEASLQKHSGDIMTLDALAYYYDALGQSVTAKQYRQRADALRRFVPKVGNAQ